jgi:hypothetical protein
MVGSSLDNVETDRMCEYKRSLMHGLSCISTLDFQRLSHKVTYEACYNIVLCGHARVVEHMLRLAANAIVRNNAPNRFKDAFKMVSCVVSYYNAMTRAVQNELDITSFGNAAYRERKAWSERVLERVVPLWREFYLRPGGLFVRRRSLAWNTMAQGKRVLLVKEVGSTKRSRHT